MTLAKLGTAHGYQIAAEAEPYTVTHAGLDGAAIYRTLRRLESTKCVTSSWDTGGAGPARRLYTLTDRGREHLGEWVEVLQGISSSVDALARESSKLLKGQKRGKVATAAAG